MSICLGYTPNADCLQAIVKLAHKLRDHDEHLIYLLDRMYITFIMIEYLWPLEAVLGDNGRLYVAEDVIPLYRELLSVATITTPNWFEVEYVLITYVIRSMLIQIR